MSIIKIIIDINNILKISIDLFLFWISGQYQYNISIFIVIGPPLPLTNIGNKYWFSCLACWKKLMCKIPACYLPMTILAEGPRLYYFAKYFFIENAHFCKRCKYIFYRKNVFSFRKSTQIFNVDLWKLKMLDQSWPATNFCVDWFSKKEIEWVIYNLWMYLCSFL